MTYLFFSFSSQTSGGRSDAAVSWLVTWKDPPSLRKAVSKAACLLFKQEKKMTTKERKPMPDLDSSSRLVMHHHTSRLLFIISQIKPAAKFSPTPPRPPIMIIPFPQFTSAPRPLLNVLCANVLQKKQKNKSEQTADRA